MNKYVATPNLSARLLPLGGKRGLWTNCWPWTSQRRQAISQGDELRARRNQASRAIGQLRSQGQDAPEDVVREMREVGQEIDVLEQQTKGLDERIHSILLELPNLPRPDVPRGFERGRECGSPPMGGAPGAGLSRQAPLGPG